MKLNNGHIETILTSLHPFFYKERGWSEVYNDKNGNKVTLLHYTEACSNTAIIMIHGWFGSLNSPILYKYSSLFINMGLNVVCIGLKDHSGACNLNKSIFAFSDIDYIQDSIRYIATKYKKVVLFGLSFGANIILRLRNIDQSVKGQILISPVFDIDRAFCTIEKKIVYKKILLYKWKKYLRLKSKIFPTDYNFSKSLKSESNNQIISGLLPYIGFKTVQEYLDYCSVKKKQIKDIVVPTLILHAENDPIIEISNVSHVLNEILHNSHTHYYVKKSGGHCPFVNEYLLSWINDNHIIHP